MDHTAGITVCLPAVGLTLCVVSSAPTLWGGAWSCSLLYPQCPASILALTWGP